MSRRYRCGPIFLPRLCRVLRQCSGGVQLFEAGVHSCESLQNTMPLSNECLRVATRTLTMPTANCALGALAQKTRWCGRGLVPLSCYGARTGAGRNASPGAGLDGLRGDAHRFSHSRGIAAGGRRQRTDSCKPTRLSGERLLTPAGGYLFLRPPGGASRYPHYWTGARRNALADARSPGRSTPPSAKRRAKAAKARGRRLNAAGAPTYNA